MVQMINEDFLGPKDLRLNGLDFANGAHKIPKIAIQWFGFIYYYFFFYKYMVET